MAEGRKYYTYGHWTRAPTSEEVEQRVLVRAKARADADAKAQTESEAREAKVTRAKNPTHAELLRIYEVQVDELQKLAMSDKTFSDFINSGQNMVNLAKRLAELNDNNFLMLSDEYNALTLAQKKDYLKNYNKLTIAEFLEIWYKSHKKPIPRAAPALASATPREFTTEERKVLNQIKEEERKAELSVTKLRELHNADVLGEEVDENKREKLQSILRDAMKQHDELVGDLMALFSANGMDRRSAINLAGRMTDGTYKEGKKLGEGKPRKCRKCGLPR